MAKKIFLSFLCTMMTYVLFATTNKAYAMYEGFTATELSSTETIVVDGTKDTVWENATSFNLNKIRQTYLNDETKANTNCATGTISVMYNSSKLYLFAEINDSTKLNNVSAWDPFNGLEYDSYKYNTDYLNIQLDIKHSDPTNYDQAWGSTYNDGKAVAAHFELAAGAGELTYSADGTSGWVYDTSNEMFTLSEYAKTHSTIYSVSTDTGYTYEMVLDLSEAGVTDFAAGKTIGLYVGYWDRFESSGGTWGEQSLTTTEFQFDNYEPWNGPGWLPEVTFKGVPSSITATRTDKTITADGIKDSAYNNAMGIEVSHVAWENENVTPATATMYLLWDTSYLYVFVDVVDDSYYAYQEGTWLEHRDALEMIVDLYHNTSYTGGYGDAYRGTKMCEGYYKIAAGVGQATVDTTIQGTHWMWDDQKNNGSYASVVTENGYTVEYKIALGKDAAEFMVEKHEIGLGVKIYDKHTDDKSGSVTVLEGKNDAQHEGPHNLSSIRLVGMPSPEEEAAKALATAKTEAKATLTNYKSADLYREAEQTQLAAAIDAGKAAIDAATTTDAVSTALTEAKSAIDGIKTKAEYEAEELAQALATAKTEAKADLASYKTADLYREAEQTLLATAINNGNTAIDAATTVAGVNEALTAAKTEINALKTKAEYEVEEALAEAKTEAKEELANYKSADLYREAEQALLATAISNGNTAIDAALNEETINQALTNAKAVIDEIKTKAEYEAEEALAAAKTEAKTTLASYKSADLYREAEQALLATAVNNGNTAIDAATTVEAVNEALTAAKTEIDALKTKAEYEEEENLGLENVRVTAKAEIAAYKNKDDYRTAEQAQLEAIISAANAEIDAASSFNEIYALVEAVKVEMNALKTNAQYEEEEAALALANAKTEAKEELANYKSADLYREAEKVKLAAAIEAGNTAIDAATTIEAVNTELTNAKSKINALRTKAQYEAQEAQILATAKTEAKEELASYKSVDLYRQAEQELLTNAINDGNTAIDAATTVETVNEALTAAKTEIDAIKTKAQYEVEEAAQALATAKIKAKETLAGYKSADLYRDAEKVKLAIEIAAGNTAIDEATTIDEVNVALGTAKGKVDALKTKAEYEAEEVLPNAKSEAKATLASYKTADLYREAEQALLTTAINNGNTAIDAAATVEAVNEALAAAKTEIDGIKTKAMYEAEEQKAAEEAAKKALADAKSAAITTLEGYKTADLYREAEQASLAKAVLDGKTAINAATTVEAVNEALATAKAAIDTIKTKAMYEAEEQKAAEEAAKKALNDAKDNAKKELEAYKSVDDYRTTEGVAFLIAIDNGKAAIDAAKTEEAVKVALEVAKKAIDTIKTKAQYEAEEAAQALETAKAEAKKELEAYKNLDGLSEEQKVEVANKVAEGKSAIDAAKTQEEVASALAAAKTSLDSITPIPPKKNGCSGSIVATLMSMTTLVACLVLFRKRIVLKKK